jgi:hypothetical protein
MKKELLVRLAQLILPVNQKGNHEARFTGATAL